MGREIKRNPIRSGHYGRRVAQESADIRKERLPGNRRIDGKVLKEALSLLKTEDRSPMQISGFLSLKSAHISHGTIYKRIRSDGSGELRAHCRHKMKYRHHVKVSRKTKVRNIPNRTGIHDRPNRNRRETFRGSGDGSCHRQGAEKRPADPVRTFCELPAHGKNPERIVNMAVRLLSPSRKNELTITTDNGSGRLP